MLMGMNCLSRKFGVRGPWKSTVMLPNTIFLKIKNPTSSLQEQVIYKCFTLVNSVFQIQFSHREFGRSRTQIYAQVAMLKGQTRTTYTVTLHHSLSFL